MTHEKQELMWIQMILRNKNTLHIGVYYGKQESRTPLEVLEEEYTILNTDLKFIMNNNNEAILVGDFNAKKKNLHLLHNLIETNNLHNINNSPICIGKWTRVNTKNPNEKSVLDYVMCTNNMKHAIQKMIIDEEGEWKIEGKNQSDHNTIILDTEIKIPKIPVQRQTIWKINKNTNWEKVEKQILCKEKEITREIKQNVDINRMYDNIIKTLNKIYMQEIGKITIKDNKPRGYDKEVKQKLEEKRNAKKAYNMQKNKNANEELKNTKQRYMLLQTECKSLIAEKQKTYVERQLEHIIQDNGLNSKTFYNMYRKITKHTNDDFYSIKAEDGTTIYEENRIMKTIAEYFEKLYKTRRNRQRTKTIY